jgi:hypothetical protein
MAIQAKAMQKMKDPNLPQKMQTFKISLRRIDTGWRF